MRPPHAALWLWLSLLAVVGGGGAGCYQRVQFVPGDECELTSNCAIPLICHLGHCRVECRGQRDCAAGLSCVRDELGLGGCQIPRETECSLSSDCPAFLVCRFGYCTNACEEDRDCPAGAQCSIEEGGGRGCRDVSTTECRLNSDCEAPYVCAVDRRCREECRTDRDCRDGERCLAGSPSVCGTLDAGLALDAGPDAFVPDAFVTPDASESDGGTPIVGPPGIPLLAGGLTHTCAAPSPGDLRCWGENLDGQLGTGTTTANVGPFALSARGLTDIRVVGVGATHTCVIDDDTLYCWGDNAEGQVGTGSGMPRHVDPVAITLPGVPTDVSCGNEHTCAIAGGALYCWGIGSSGQLGLGDTSPRSTPTAVPGLPAAPVEVSTRGDHTCARLVDGTVACFGHNGNRQVGTEAASPVTVPTRVAGLSRVVQVMAGTTHTCALRDLGDVLCWGLNTAGQLGTAEGGSRATPMVTAPIPAPVVELGLGSAHSCALTADGVYCWGSNSFGQLGYTAAGGFSRSPGAVPGLGASASVRAGTNHTCVWVGATEVRCFGSNVRDQLDGTGVAPGGVAQVTVAWP